MEERKPVYLLKVDANANNNKYYQMTPQGNDTFLAEFGRVDSKPQKKVWSMSQWDKKYKEKIKKGYKDYTDLRSDLIQKEQPKTKSEYKEISNKIIAEIVDRLQSMAKQKIQANYKVSSKQVTQAMVDRAQELIDMMAKYDEKTPIDEFNETLIELFGVIPRRMDGKVKDYIAKDTMSYAKIIKDEQDLLDVMRGQVIQHTVEDSTEDNETEQKEETILDAMGLVFEEVDDNDIKIIKEKLGDCSNMFYKAWRVRNVATKKRFDNFVNKENIKDIKLFWHGSRSENWWSIINTGLVLRPTNAVITGKMFGYGIYYAPKARKSLGYTSYNGSYWAHGNSNSAFMALMEVAYGEPYDVYSFDSKYYNFNYERLQNAKPGANCLHAHAGSMLRNDEVIVYKEEQSTIKYLVELR